MVHMKEFDPRIPYNDLAFLPPDILKIETIEILRNENKAVAAISELKGIANIIPNQSILINSIVLQEAKDSSEIENIITTQEMSYIKLFRSAPKKMMLQLKKFCITEKLCMMDFPGFLKERCFQ